MTTIWRSLIRISPLSGSVARFWTPGLGASTVQDWLVEGGHVAGYYTYFREAMDAQRASPRPGLLGALMDAEVDGDRLSNDEIIANEPTAEFLAKHAPDTPIRRPMGQFEGPMSNRKLRELLGFREAHNWRQYVPAGDE